MPLAVVTGANSGIGHAFAQLLIDEGYEVHATDVNVGDKLQDLQCRLHVLDVRSPESISAFATQLEGKRIDVLLNVAGIMFPREQDALDTVTPDVLHKIFETNAFGPLLLTQALLPNLMAMPGSVVGIVSSRVGSIGDNTSGGAYAYRSSKAAVNSIGRTMAMDLKDKGIVVSLLHPGYVKTNLNPGSEPHPESVEPEEAASKLWKVLMSKQIEETGKFWRRPSRLSTVFRLTWLTTEQIEKARNYLGEDVDKARLAIVVFIARFATFPIRAKTFTISA